MQEHDQHVSPIKTPKQLIVVVVLAFAIPIGLAALLSQLVTSGAKGSHEDDAAILARIQPVGQVQLAAASGPKGQLTGEQVYGQVCKTCHAAGVLNAPKFGDKAAWAKVIAQGQATTVDHALKGIRAMPPKGGATDLADVEVERAVVYMATAAGAAWKAPAVVAPVNVTASKERTGSEVVAAACGKCHTTGEGGAPKIGDRAAWRERAKRG
ncbi:MAG TPA: c-type cytochrome, partial [Gallionella sp.]|nr:c-type cytochrome [Gallionella sp.]